MAKKRSRRVPHRYRLGSTDGGQTVRDVVLDRIQALGISRNQLASKSGLSVHPSTVFRFLSGKETVSSVLDQVLPAVGLELVEVDGRPAWLDQIERAR